MYNIRIKKDIVPINPDNYESGNETELWRNELVALMEMFSEKFEIFCRGLLGRIGIDADATI